MNPDGVPLAFYIGLSAIIFLIGLVGVLTRRNPLLLLLAVELMLNSGNLALVGFSRYWNTNDGQIFALRRDGGRRHRGRHRPRAGGRRLPSTPRAGRRSDVLHEGLGGRTAHLRSRLDRPRPPPARLHRALGCGRESPTAGSRALVAIAMPVLAFAATVVIFITMLRRDSDNRLEVSTLWNWVQSDGLSIDLTVQIDTLSILMMLIITGIGSLIVIYSTEYMNEDRDYKRFFAEMSFFIFAMLLLVEAATTSS